MSTPSPCGKPTPCKQCPFARATPKTYLDTMGDNSERFTGQAIGPFSLPCHMTREFQSWRADPNGCSACVGAAIYRSNVGYTHLPGALPLLPPDKETIFASPAELYAHHKGISVEEAEEFLKVKTPLMMAIEEMHRPVVLFAARNNQED